MFNKKAMLLVALVVAAAAASGCGPTRVLFQENTTGDKLIQQYATPATSGEKGFYDYHLRVCDLADTGAITECKDTLILQNVAINSGGL